jgi:hypothetical protein
MRTILLIAAAAALALATSLACGKSGYDSRAVASTPIPPSARTAPQPRTAAPAQPKPKASAPSSAASKAPGAHVEQLHTPDGIVTITRTPKATPADLGVPAFNGAQAKESSTWRLRPPKGREWLLAIGNFTSGAGIESLAQFYRKALEKPASTAGSGKSAVAPKVEARRAASKGETTVVLSRVTDLSRASASAKAPKEPRESESIVVRLARAAGAKATTILIRRSIKGAPVKIEPSGELPGPSGPPHRVPPTPRPRRAPNPRGISISAPQPRSVPTIQYGRAAASAAQASA